MELFEAPLGMVFPYVVPLTVKRLEPGSAERAGVRAGWVIKSVNGESLEDLDYNGAIEVVKAAIVPLPRTSKLPPAGLIAEFSTPSGIQRVGFSRMPVGITFNMNRVTHVERGSNAEEQGVQFGWELVSVGGVPVSSTDLQGIREQLQVGVDMLADTLNSPRQDVSNQSLSPRHDVTRDKV